MAILLLAGWLLSQAIVPARPRAVLPGDGDMTDHVFVPPAVDSLLHRACYDCHSAETRWPWYSHVAPVSWLIVDHVRHGRGDLDFSSWSMDPIREPTPVQQFTWICQTIERGKMPPRLYRWAHPAARLSSQEKALICQWTREALDRLPAREDGGV